MVFNLEQLRAMLAARMRASGVTIDPTDPRLAPMLAHVQASLTPQSGDRAETAAAPLPAVSYDLPQLLANALSAYLDLTRAGASLLGASMWIAQAPALAESEAGRGLLACSPADRGHLVCFAYSAWVADSRNMNASGLRRVLSDLLRGKVEFTVQQAVTLAKAATQDGFSYSSHSPNQAVATALKRHVEAHGLDRDLRDAIGGLRTRMASGHAAANSEGRKLLAIVDAMLVSGTRASGGEPRFAASPDAWGKALQAYLQSTPFERRAHTTSLLGLASKGGQNAKPGKGWLKTAQAELARVGGDAIGATLIEIVELYEPGNGLAPDNQNTLRALLWLAAMAAPEHISRRLEVYAQNCMTFDAVHFAYKSLVLGNAAIHAFSLMSGTTGVGGLSRLKRKLKRPGEIKTVDKAIVALAAARGMSAGELEEIGLPDYGFAADGTLTIAIGPARADLTITDDCTVETTWHGADGRALSGPPAAAKDAHAAELKAFKVQSKEIAETLKAQRLRIERLYLGNRAWSLDIWRARYLEEPLVSRLAQRLIWAFEVEGRWVAGLLQDGCIFDAAGTRLDTRPETKVRLWHPMQSEPAHVLAWRRRLGMLGITQPFKQAHREIYVLTDAERSTNVYSNRFAGHIVEQHLFRALCQTRGWNCPAFGAWDNGGGQPLKRFPELGLQVEFWVDPIDETMGENYMVRHLSTDQVRFTRTDGEPVALDTLDPVLFSELLRDADLFVGVAGIANDPTWGDRGERAFGEYWTRAAFGELGQSGETRHAVLSDLLPGLSIAPRCRLEPRYLIVEGKIRTYRIHLGSANIQMEPNNQYLCIVQDRKPQGSRVRLPFEGDGTLSLILSKAFMLVDDDKIKDPSIKSQIRHGMAGA